VNAASEASGVNASIAGLVAPANSTTRL